MVKAPLVLLELMDLQVQRDLLDQQDLLALLERLVSEDLEVDQASQVNVDLQDLLVLLENVDHKALQDPEDQEDLLAQLDLLVLEENLVVLDCQGKQDHEVNKVNEELLENQEHLEKLGHLEVLGDLD